MRAGRILWIVVSVVLLAQAAAADVVRIEILRRDDYGTHDRVIGRVFYAVNPTDPANAQIADIALAPRNAAGLVEFSGDLLFFQPKANARARGAVFIEPVNRGRDQSLGLMSDAHTSDLAPESWDLGDRFLLQQGFAVAFLGWQFDVEDGEGLRFRAPIADVAGIVRATFVEDGGGRNVGGFRVPYCAADVNEAGADLQIRTKFEEPPKVLPRQSWRFSPDGCAVLRPEGFAPGAYEAIYTAKGSPVAGLGLAAIRDFASYMKYGGRVSTLRENAPALSRVIGFGYSQTGRLLRDFVREGFNADERGRPAFDALMIASAGAGGGSFNHRFAMPGQAGNSVLSILRPVDLPPFTDGGVVAKATGTRTLPKIFYTFSSTEYWARAGSLTHTSDDGQRDVPLAATSRLYFLAGTPHAAGPLPTRRGLRYRGYQNGLNFAEQRWAMRALIVDLDEWIRGTEPPASRYPTIAKREMVAREAIHFPAIPRLAFAPYLPPVFRMNYGTQFGTTHVITNEPPTLGAPYTVLLPQVDANGNDVGGIPLPEIAVPLGTFTGWNISLPQLAGLRYLAGLVGSFEPFPPDRDERLLSGDSRPSIAERYPSRQDYLDKITRASDDLVKQRLFLAADVALVVERASRMWDALVN